jgi:hypothetical protein
MTTIAPKQALHTALAQREREAWNRYGDALRALEGRVYEDAEIEAWAELQRDLRSISAERDASL